MESNPYEATHTDQQLPYGRIAPTPIKFMKEAYRLIEGQYFLFFGIVLCGLLLGGLAPMGILMGPMIVGVYLCFLEREANRPVKFDVLFRGFDHFLTSLWVMLTMLLCNIVVTFLFIVFAAVCGFMIASMMQANAPAGIPAYVGVAAIIFAYGLLLLFSIMSVIPFAFAFQLIAEHQMSASEAMKTSMRAVMHNLWPLTLTFIGMSFLGMLAALLCYFPVFLLMPIQFGATFVIYRKIFPKGSTPHFPN